MRNGDDEKGLLDELSTAPAEVFDGPEAPDDFREAVWRYTARSIRRRGRMRRFTMASVALAAAYAMGVATMFVWSSQVPRAAETAIAIHQDAPQEPDRPAPAMAEREPGELVPRTLLSDREALARRLGEATTDERVRLLKRAGDRYLNEWGDVALASKCYRSLLDSTPLDKRTIVEPKDNWLLISLKRDRQKELRYEKART